MVWGINLRATKAAANFFLPFFALSLTYPHPFQKRHVPSFTSPSAWGHKRVLFLCSTLLKLICNELLSVVAGYWQRQIMDRDILSAKLLMILSGVVHSFKFFPSDKSPLRLKGSKSPGPSLVRRVKSIVIKWNLYHSKKKHSFASVDTEGKCIVLESFLYFSVVVVTCLFVCLLQTIMGNE